jgi:hypothetical protein
MLNALATILFERWKRGAVVMACAVGTLVGTADGATLGVTPSTVSNRYSSVLTLQIAGLTNGEQAIIQHYLDVNTNGTADGGELLIDAFPITDGGVSVIGGVTNLNVPYDNNSATGAITTTISMGTALDGIIGQHIFRLVSPFGNFPPRTSLLVITNVASGASVAGTVFSGGSPLPFGIAVAMSQPDNSFVGGVVADATGHYQFKLKPGTYVLFPAFADHYTDQEIAAFVTLTNGESASADLFLTNGSPANTLSGQITDATNGNTLGGVFLQLESGSLFGIAFTDSSGNYSVPLSPSFWRIRPEADGLARRAYVTPGQRLQVDMTAGSVPNINFAFPKANALFYGRITDNLAVPFANIKFFGEDDGDELKASGYSDANGNYVMAVLGSTNQWRSSPESQDNPGLVNYIISNGLGDTNISAGQAARQDFVAIRATAQITGRLEDNLGNPVNDVSIYANADIGGISYNTSALTDNSGNYLLPAANGAWSLHVNCCGNEGLDSHGLYDPAGNGHNVSVPPTNAVLNITVYPTGTPVLSQFARSSSNQFSFILNGSVGANYTVQASTNLSISNWFNLFSLNLTSSVMFLQDNQATNQNRFYRVLKN